METVSSGAGSVSCSASSSEESEAEVGYSCGREAVQIEHGGSPQLMEALMMSSSLPN